MYRRTLPRDAFNEAKFIKSLARITLLITNERCPLEYVFDQIHAVYPELPYPRSGPAGFIINLRDSDGGLECENFKLYRIGDVSGSNPIKIYSMLNCRSPYNLVCETHDGGEIEVFTDAGELTDEFKQEIGAPSST